MSRHFDDLDAVLERLVEAGDPDDEASLQERECRRGEQAGLQMSTHTI